MTTDFCTLSGLSGGTFFRSSGFIDPRRWFPSYAVMGGRLASKMGQKCCLSGFGVGNLLLIFHSEAEMCGKTLISSLPLLVGAQPI